MAKGAGVSFFQLSCALQSTKYLLDPLGELHKTQHTHCDKFGMQYGMGNSLTSVPTMSQARSQALRHHAQRDAMATACRCGIERTCQRARERTHSLVVARFG
jgi:hypothetical protein